jgi:Nif-specific regulatory protein
MLASSVRRYAEKMSKSISRISTTAINMMMAYHWPGNVRELENCVEHAVLLSTDGVIHGHNLPPSLQMPGAPEGSQPGSLRCAIEMMERDMLVDALKRCGGNNSAVARELEITPRMVRYKIQKLKISPALFKTTIRNGR